MDVNENDVVTEALAPATNTDENDLLTEAPTPGTSADSENADRVELLGANLNPFEIQSLLSAVPT